jgi:histidine phosphotransferase ChpT
MNTKDTLAFLGSLSSKICHDIVAPVSAVDMGISLLDEHLPNVIKTDPAYTLLKDSLDKTLRRINFFRYAFAFGKTDTL